MHFPLPIIRAALALAACALAWPAFGATRTYPGAAPCNGTLQACIDAAGDGDVIELAFSTSNAEMLDVRKSITLQPAAGHTPTLQWLMAYATTQTIDVTVQNITFTAQVLGIVGAGGGSLRLHVLGNTFPDRNSGAIELRQTSAAGTYGSYFATLEGNRITAHSDASCTNTISIALTQSSEGRSEVVLRDNDVHLTDLDECAGIAAYVSAGGLNLTVERNRVYGSNFNNGIWVWANGGSANADIYNNLVYGQAGNSGASGAIVVNFDSGSDGSAHVVNNTSAHNRTGIAIGARTDRGARLRGSLRNNIAAFNTLYGLAYPTDLGADFVESHNLVHGNGTLTDSLPVGPNRRTGNPAFVDAANGNYRLTAASDALNRGLDGVLPASIVQDLAGAARVVGSAIDIGAFEYPIVVAAIPVPTLGRWSLWVAALLLALAGIRYLPRRR